MTGFKRRFDVSRFDVRAYDYLLDLSKPGFAWECLRRNDDFRRAAFGCRFGAPRPVHIERGLTLHRLRRRFAVAERWGLHWIPDPRLTALQTTPFWRSDMLRSSLALGLSPQPLLHAERHDLTAIPATMHLIVPVTGAPELVLRGTHYAGHFTLGGHWKLLTRRFFLKIEMGAFRHLPRQFQGAKALRELIAGATIAPWDERAFDPRRLRRALIAYDVEHGHGGTHWDVAAVWKGPDRVRAARTAGDKSLYEQVRRAIAMGELFVSKDWRRLLA